MLWTPAPSPSAGAVPTHHLVQDVLQEVAVLVLLCRPLSQLLQTSLRNKDMGGLGIQREWAWWGGNTSSDRQGSAAPSPGHGGAL